jgi:hypothetical protein
MSEVLSKTPEKYIAMRTNGASAEDVFRRARSDGYKAMDCAFIVSGLFGIEFREARQIGFALGQEPDDIRPETGTQTHPLLSEPSIAYRVVDVMKIEAFGSLMVALTPQIPDLGPGQTVMVRISVPSGAALEVSGVVEYRKSPPLTPVLLRFDGLQKADVPIGSEIRFHWPEKSRT